MLEFKLKLDTDTDLITVSGPSNLIMKEHVYSVNDIAELVRTYMLRFCNTTNFDEYRINKSTSHYTLSKNNKLIEKYDTYFDAFEKMCDLQYEDMKCPAGFVDCIWDGKDYKDNYCKECAAHGGCHYDDEDK